MTDDMRPGPNDIRSDLSPQTAGRAGVAEDFPSRRLSTLAHVFFALATVLVIAAYGFVLLTERHSPGWILQHLEPRPSTIAPSQIVAAPVATPPATVAAREEAKHDGPLLERGRSVPAGEWTDLPFDPERFSASDGAHWTVHRENVVNCAYTLVGNTMTFSWFITNSSTKGGPANFLQISLPSRYFPVRRVVGTATYSEGGNSWLNGVAQIDTKPSLLLVSKNGYPAAKWAAGEGVATAGEITFEVLERAPKRSR